MSALPAMKMIAAIENCVAARGHGAAAASLPVPSRSGEAGSGITVDVDVMARFSAM